MRTKKKIYDNIKSTQRKAWNEYFYKIKRNSEWKKENERLKIHENKKK